MDTILIFDFNNLLHKGFSVHEHLEFNGLSTGGLFGFLTQMCAQINNHKPSKILVCNDKPPYFRKDIYPQYKEQRRKNRDPERYEIIHQNRKYCQELLEILNITFWEVVGFEADDLIAEICDVMSCSYDKTIVVSNDDDLFQLLRFPEVYLQRSKVLYSREDFKKDYPTISFKNFLQVKSLAGGHNGVPGFKGIGMKTALKIVKDKKRFKEFLKENEKEYLLYKQLTELPFPGKPIETMYTLSSVNYSEGRIMRFLAKYGIVLKPFMKKALESL